MGSLVARPSFPPTTTTAVRPPPISGGTLLVTSDGNHAIAADPDRDAVYGIDLVAQKVSFTVALQAGDEPGRIAEDGSGQVHVALRRGGALVTLDETTGAVIARRNVCPAPRGVAWDSTTDVVWVACATGELVSLPAAGGAATQTLTVERDLRDVIIQDGAMSITEMRSAQVLRVGAGGTITRRDNLAPSSSGSSPQVAWRAIPGPSGRIFVAYQNESLQNVAVQTQGGYGSSGCNGGGPPPPNGQVRPLDVDDGGSEAEAPDADSDAASDAGGLQPQQGMQCPIGVVTSEIGAIDSAGGMAAAPFVPGVLPVDLALSRDGTTVAVATPGSAYTQGMSTVTLYVLLPSGAPAFAGGLVVSADGFSVQPIAVAFAGSGKLLVQTRQPAALWIGSALDQAVLSPVALSSTSVADTGIDVFHTQAGADVACASCHPEGGDDGHVWRLDGNSRRTPSLRGTIQGTAPYHWPGDEPTLDALLSDVYETRMDGAPLDMGQSQAVESWVYAVPAPPAPSWVDPTSAQRGAGVFTRSATRCSTCHSGSKFTNNATVDVGTGGSFQVPPLVGVGWNMPIMHDGCAATMADRFGKCATSQHGSTASLSAQDLTDLENYLETL
jgi:hypothetical protein